MKSVLWFFFCMVMLACGAMLAVELVEEVSSEKYQTLWLTLWVTTVVGLIGLGITFLFSLFRKKRNGKRPQQYEEKCVVENFAKQHTGVR